MKTQTTKFLLFTFCIIVGSMTATAQPANDLIENAIDLAYVPITYEEEAVDFDGATNTNDHTPASGCGLSQPAVWYKFTAAQNGNVFAGILNPNDAVIVFFEGPETGVTSGMQLTYINQQNNPCDYSPLANIQATAGITYYIYMRNVVDSDIVINASDVFIVPANDLIENATDVNNMEDYDDNDIHFFMATATDDGGQTNCTTANFPGVWYEFTADVDGQVVAGIDSEPGESLVIFYSAPNENINSGTDLTYVDQATNPCDFDNLTSINATAGTSYYVFAWSNLAYATVSLNLSGILGTQENVLEGFEFYPNPVVDNLNLNARSIIEGISVYNIQGKKIFSKKLGTKKSLLNLEKLSSGLYIMEVLSEGITARYKLVKK